MMNALRKSNLSLVKPVEQGLTTTIKKPPICAKCNDDGFVRANVPYGHPQFGKAIECVCMPSKRQVREQQDSIFASGILEMSRFKNATLENFMTNVPGVKRAKAKAMEFAEELYGWLVLLGPCGCGKTHLAAAIARLRIATGDSVIILPTPDLLDYLRAAFSPAAVQTYGERFETMKKVSLLVLDDFGAQVDTAWANEKLFQLLNYRYNQGLATIITSNNITLEGVDQRIYSRLHDAGLVTMVVMDSATDYRPRKGE